MVIRTTFKLIFCVIIPLILSAQKKSLDTAAYNRWPTLENAAISNDGNYAFHIIGGADLNEKNLIVTNIDNGTEVGFRQSSNPTFSSDSKTLYFKYGTDSLGVLRLKAMKTEFIGNVESFDLIGPPSNQFLLYRRKGDSTLVIKNLKKGTSEYFKHVINYWLNYDKSKLVIRGEGIKDDPKVETNVVFINLVNGQEYICSLPNAILNVAFASNKCAFEVAGPKTEQLNRTVYLFNESSGKTALLIDSTSLYKFSGYYISSGRLVFNAIGDKLFIELQRDLPSVNGDPSNVNVEVWSYADMYLPPEQHAARDKFLGNKFNAAFDLNTGEIMRLDSVGSITLFPSTVERFLINIEIAGPQGYFKREQWPSLNLFDLKTGELQGILIKATSQFSGMNISPDEKYIIWFDHDSLCWKSYDIDKKRVQNISKEMPYPIYDDAALKIGRCGAWGFAGWIMAEQAILLYDQFDIWKVSLKGKFEPVNLTRGLGRKHGITFTVAERESNVANSLPSDTLILVGYNRWTKDGGYWQLPLAHKFALGSGHLQPFSVSSRMPVGFYRYASGRILKAKNRNRFIVLRESAEQSRNVFYTSDLTKYKKISNIHPERSYNWLSAELRVWKMNDGMLNQGILYKPENFDSTRRYPLIINFYEKRTDELHEFIRPEYSPHNINIPSFTSEGYLIFVPDIYSLPGRNGIGTINCIESAAQYLSSLSFVDSTKMGLQGHSYGGWQTNYIITHSTRFAAACEAAGVSNQISAYGQLGFGNKTPRDAFYETAMQGSPYGVGVTPWTYPDLYIDNSPVFKIGQIRTPLLMMHNKDDGSVPFAQAIELFIGMRRAGKKVWLLQYEGNGHILEGSAAEDFHKRMLQFFGAFLKGESEPDWMKSGFPARISRSIRVSSQN